jgi:hypothetical protein
MADSGPMNITVSCAGQHGTPRPFLMVINGIKVAKDGKVASEIIVPVLPAPAHQGLGDARTTGHSASRLLRLSNTAKPTYTKVCDHA